MSSTFTINFSLRQNKAIERSIVFEGLQKLLASMETNPIYVGLGSLWFQDFQMAYSQLGVRQMYSIEGEASLVKRSQYNRPFRTIEVMAGWTTEVVPELLQREELLEEAWITWLDYDQELNEDRRDELVDLIERVPQGSVVLTTFNAKAKNYGHDPAACRSALLDLFGADVLDPYQGEEPFTDGSLGVTLANCLQAYLVRRSLASGRDPNYVPAFRLVYRDSATMATVGGVLPSSETAAAVAELVKAESWVGIEEAEIATNPLTFREVQALMQLMPCDPPLTPGIVQSLGFDLSADQINFFEKHYLRYPKYAELAGL